MGILSKCRVFVIRIVSPFGGQKAECLFLSCPRPEFMQMIFYRLRLISHILITRGWG